MWLVFGSAWLMADNHDLGDTGPGGSGGGPGHQGGRAEGRDDNAEELAGPGRHPHHQQGIATSCVNLFGVCEEAIMVHGESINVFQ